MAAPTRFCYALLTFRYLERFRVRDAGEEASGVGHSPGQEANGGTRRLSMNGAYGGVCASGWEEWVHAVYMPFAGRQKDEGSPGEPASLHMHSRRALPPVSEALLEAGSAPRDVLPAVARHLADSLGDACVIRLAAGAGVSTDAVALYHRDPVALALLAELRAAQPRLWADAFNAQVLQSGEPVVLATVPA